MLRVRRLLTNSLAALALFAITAAAAQAGTACPEHFAAGQAPQVTNTRMQVRTRELCFAGFAVLHSGVTRTALFSGAPDPPVCFGGRGSDPCRPIPSRRAAAAG